MQAHGGGGGVLGEAAVLDDPGLDRRRVAAGGDDRRTLDHMTTAGPCSGQTRHGRQDRILIRRFRLFAGTGQLRAKHETLTIRDINF
jgi:hypothetical protein